MKTVLEKFVFLYAFGFLVKAFGVVRKNGLVVAAGNKKRRHADFIHQIYGVNLFMNYN